MLAARLSAFLEERTRMLLTRVHPIASCGYTYRVLKYTSLPAYCQRVQGFGFQCSAMSCGHER